MHHQRLAEKQAISRRRGQYHNWRHALGLNKCSKGDDRPESWEK